MNLFVWNVKRQKSPKWSKQRGLSLLAARSQNSVWLTSCKDLNVGPVSCCLLLWTSAGRHRWEWKQGLSPALVWCGGVSNSTYTALQITCPASGIKSLRTFIGCNMLPYVYAACNDQIRETGLSVSVNILFCGENVPKRLWHISCSHSPVRWNTRTYSS